MVATKGGRLAFMHDGRVVYEWEQALDEVHLYVTPPAGVTARMLSVVIAAGHLTLGIKGNPPFLNADLAGVAMVKESTWMMEDGELHVLLVKAHKATAWPSVFVGHGALDDAAATEVRKRMLLERFGEEHPAFDFSGADVSGMVPDPRTFMGGVK